MDYIDYLYSKKFTTNTINSYLYDLGLFEEFLGDRDINDTEKSDILKYMVYLSNKDYSEKSIARKVTALKSYFYYAMNMGLVERDPTFQVSTPRIEQNFNKEIYSLKELELFINYPLENGDRNIKSMRDFLIFNILFYTGINLTDLLTKKIEDLDMSLGFIVHKDRYIFLNEDILITCRDYVALLIEKYPENIFLFVNMRGEQLTRQGAWKIFHHYSKLADIKVGAQNLIDGYKYYNRED